MLDYEKLNVYQVSLEFTVWAYEICKKLTGNDRHLRDQLLRASQSILLNIAEGSGKFPSADRRRFLQIAGGSARECGAIMDILSRCQIISEEQAQFGKNLLVRIVSMLTKMISVYSNEIREDVPEYQAD